MSAKAISTAGITPDEFIPYSPKDVMKMKEMSIDCSWTPVNSFNNKTASCNIVILMCALMFRSRLYIDCG